jgi:hypothetical protein
VQPPRNQHRLVGWAKRSVPISRVGWAKRSVPISARRATQSLPVNVGCGEQSEPHLWPRRSPDAVRPSPHPTGAMPPLRNQEDHLGWGRRSVPTAVVGCGEQSEPHLLAPCPRDTGHISPDLSGPVGRNRQSRIAPHVRSAPTRGNTPRDCHPRGPRHLSSHHVPSRAD